MTPKTLGEVKEQKLPGYELKTGYLLILKHGLSGTFPALIAEDDELFACTDKNLLEMVWERIEKRSARIIELQLYVNEVEGVGFNVEVGDQAAPIAVLSKERFDGLAEKENPFKWAPGLFSLKKEEIVSPFA